MNALNFQRIEKRRNEKSKTILSFYSFVSFQKIRLTHRKMNKKEPIKPENLPKHAVTLGMLT